MLAPTTNKKLICLELSHPWLVFTGDLRGSSNSWAAGMLLSSSAFSPYTRQTNSKFQLGANFKSCGVQKETAVPPFYLCFYSNYSHAGKSSVTENKMFTMMFVKCNKFTNNWPLPTKPLWTSNTHFFFLLPIELPRTANTQFLFPFLLL